MHGKNKKIGYCPTPVQVVGGNLRPRPEENEDLTRMTAEEFKRVTHNLRARQIELQMQNDTLRNTQRALEKMLDKYLDLYNFAPVGYFTLDEKGRILEANLSGASMLSVERKTLLSQPFVKFIHKDDQDDFYQYFKRLRETKDRGICELKLIPSDGALVPVHMEAIAVEDGGAGDSRFRTVIYDMTDRVHAEEPRHKAMKWKNIAVLTGGIAHDYNNLLSVILGNISLVLDEINPKEDISDFLYDAEEACLTAKDLTQRLMTLSKGSSLQEKSASIWKTLKICAAEVAEIGPDEVISQLDSLAEKDAAFFKDSALRL